MPTIRTVKCSANKYFPKVKAGRAGKLGKSIAPAHLYVAN